MYFGNSKPMFPIVQLIGPEDLSEGASASAWVSMENCDHGIIVISVGDHAGAASSVTLDQATDSSGTGTKTLGFDYMYMSGQRLKFISRSATNFSVGEDVTGGTGSNVMTVTHVSNDQLTGYIKTAGSGTGTTWTDGETLTGGTSGATATADGTGTDEDILVEVAVTSDTFDIDTLTFKNYVIPVDNTMLDADNDFSHFQLDMADASSTETQASAIFIPLAMRIQAYPQISLIDAQKLT